MLTEKELCKAGHAIRFSGGEFVWKAWRNDTSLVGWALWVN